MDDSLDLSFSPVLEINKTANGLPWQAGGVGSYQIVVTNTSGVVAPGSIIVVKDNANFPSPPLTLIGINGAPGWDCNSTPGQCSYTVPAGSPVSAGTSWTFTVNASIDSNYSGGKVQNCTELYLQGAGPLELQNSSCVSVPIQPFIPPLITKRALGSMPWPSGGTGTFSISVNVPSSIASNEFIAIRDVLPNGLTLIPSSIVPAGMWNCNQSTGMCYLNGPIAAGTTVNMSFDVQLPKQCGSVQFKNCADMDVVTDNPKFPFESQGQSCVTVEVAGCSGGCIPAKLSINKTHEPADFARGSTGMIGISVTNNGSSPLFAPIQVVDQLPSGLTMSPGSFSPSADLACVAGPTTPSPQQVSCSYMGSQLNAGDSFNFNFQVNVSPRASKIVTNHAFVTKGCCSGKANDETTDRIRIGKFGVISHTGGILLPRPPSHGGNITITKNHSPKQFSTGSKGSFKIVVKNKGNKLEKGMLTVVDHMPVGLSVKTGAFRANSWRCNGGKVSSSGQVVTCTYNRTLNKKRKAILNLNTRVAAVGKFPAGVKEVKNCATASVINGDIAVGKTMPTQEVTTTACDKVKIRHVKSRGLFNLPISIGIGIGGGGSSGATPKGAGI